MDNLMAISVYDNWLHVGFALANTFGENGRTFFHEISALSPKYDRKEADSKYSSCLRQGNGAVTIGTLFHLAKEHAVTWSHPLPLRPLRPMRPAACAVYARISPSVRVCVQPFVSTSLMCVSSCEVRRLARKVRTTREGWGRRPAVRLLRSVRSDTVAAHGMKRLTTCLAESHGFFP